MITESDFLKLIELVLNEIGDNTYSADSQYYCGSGQYGFKSTHIYEHTLTEKIIRRLSYLENTIGWEVNYPQDVYKSTKVPVADLAFGHINKHYFQSVVEVKKWDGHGETQYYIWQDILKLHKYSSKEHEFAGLNKYVLSLYTGLSYDKEEIADMVKFNFVNPTVDTLNCGGNDISDALRRLVIDLKWNQEDTDLFFAKYGPVFNNVPFIEFKREYLLHDLGENIFAFLLKLKA